MQHGAGKGEALLLAAAHGARKLPALIAQVVALEQFFNASGAFASWEGIDLRDLSIPEAYQRSDKSLFAKVQYLDKMGSKK